GAEGAACTRHVTEPRMRQPHPKVCAGYLAAARDSPVCVHTGIRVASRLGEIDDEQGTVVMPAQYATKRAVRHLLGGGKGITCRDTSFEFWQPASGVTRVASDP